MEEEVLSQESNLQNNFSFKHWFSIRNLTILFIALTILNLIYIDIVTIRDPKSTIIEKVVNTTKPSDSSESSSANPTDQLCPQTCISQILDATASYKMQPTIISTISLTPSPTPETVSTVKEFFIPFGSGSSLAGDWEDVPGIQAAIDSQNYPNIKSVTFEATVRIPTGNETAYIRLYNTTDKHPIWASEISWEGGTTKFLTKSITLDSGNKTYQVQMKTSLKYQAIFDQARLHIITY